MESLPLLQKTFQAVGWALVRIGTSNLIGFVLFMALARLLTPADFGLFALAALVTDIARLISTAGLSDAVTRDAGGSEDIADTAFWVSTGLGCLLGLILWMIAPAYASLIHQPDSAPVLRALSALLPISSLGAIHTARKLRDFGHKSLAARVIGGGLLAGAAAIAAAILGLGIWSLVIQAAVTEITGVIFAWQSYSWVPRVNFDTRKLRTILPFSGTVLLTQLAALLQLRLQELLIGGFVSAAALGAYRVAWRLVDLLAQMTIQPIVTVSYVTFSHLQTDMPRFTEIFLRLIGIGAMLTIPVLLGFGVLSADLIPWLFGHKWDASISIIQVLSLMVIPMCINSLLYAALAAIGRPEAMAKSTMAQLVIIVVLAPIAVRYGVLWATVAFVLRGFLTLPYSLRMLQRETGTTVSAVAGVIVPPLVAAVIMAVILFVGIPTVREALGDGPTFLGAVAALGIVIYGTILLTLFGARTRANLSFMLPLLKSQSSRSG